MTLPAGAIVDADDWAQLPARIVHRTSDFTPHVSSTTLQSDDVLTFSVDANRVYLVRFQILVTGTGGNFKTRWSVPSGTTGVIRACHGPDATTGASDPSVLPAVRLAGSLITSDVTYALNSLTNYAYCREEAIIPVGGTAGSVTLQHAQSSSSASATTVRARSWAECYLVS